MPTVRLVDPSAPDPDAIAEAVAVLRRGGLVAIPTETVYGLAARALDEAALARIFEAKGRPPTHPLIAHVYDVAQARSLAAAWPDAAQRLADRLFPGPLTLVVPRAEHVPLALTAGGATVAVRAPKHPVARALLAAFGEPLAAPSANRYQSVSPTRAEHVVRSLGDRVDLVLDAGPTAHGIESTVVDVSSSPPRLLRPGALAIAEIRAIVPNIVVGEAFVLAEGAVRPSPGLDARHYAPRANVELAASQNGAIARAAALAESGLRVALILRSPVARSIGATARLSVTVLGETPEAFGTELFDSFHRADEAAAQVIVVEEPPPGERWLAIRDRLRRARA